MCIGYRTLLVVWLASTIASAQSLPFTYRPRVKVLAETRIDWLYPILGSSPVQPPERLLAGYDSTHQRYDLFAPPRVGPNAGRFPLILFISYRSTPFGWDYCGPTCVRHGVIYAEPLNAGNATPFPERVRIVLDVLDDVRRRYPIDPDRTYIMGHSGGGFAASRIALTLPEYIGGLLSSSAPPRLPSELWKIRRLRDRLSVVMHAGRKEAAGPEIGLVQGPIFDLVGIRTAYRVHQNLGHAMPPAQNIEQSFLWLEEGLAGRRAAAQRFPASRIASAPSREQWADAVLAEAKARVDDPALVAAGLGQLEWLRHRWPDVNAAAEAKEILSEYKSRERRPWEEEARNERLRMTRMLAERYEAAAQSHLLGMRKVSRATLAQAALVNWHKIIDESEDPVLVERAKKRLPLLEKMVTNVPVRDSAMLPPRMAETKLALPEKERVLPHLVFNIRRTFLLEELLDLLERQPGGDAIEFHVDESAIRKARLTTRRRVSVDLADASTDDVLTTVLTALGLTYQFEDGVITIDPAPATGDSDVGRVE